MLSNRRSTMIGSSVGSRRASYQPGTTVTLATSLNPEGEPHSTSPSILSSTTPDLPRYRTVRVLGAVYGSTTYAGYKDAKALMKATGAGAEAKSLTNMMYTARNQAIERMSHDCVTRGANAVVGVSFSEGEVLGFAQVSVYGTAVYVEKERPVGLSPPAEDPFANN